ncbi:hypothetical protein JXA32_03305 [Candidatus Sumerlaeota bacterium]|nr:hypothetical protein [Candidatus Sumerlaeota bacterium]
MQRLKHAILALGIAILPLSGAQSVYAQLPSGADFESPEYALGALNHADWTLHGDGSALVQSSEVYEGSAALELTSGTTVSYDVDSTEDVVWVNGWQKASSTGELPDLTQFTSGSALMVFRDDAIMCLDGDGAGSGTWTSVMSSPSNDWIQVSLRLDYTALTYECYLNGALVGSDLGFLYNSTSMLNGFTAHAGNASSFLDDIEFSTVVATLTKSDIINHLMGVVFLSGAEYRSADINQDDARDVADVLLAP